jgi:pimeloyl-ACP methyl ester carboxylesterase
MHDEIAALSTRGERRTVEGAGHFIPFDKPDAVIAAIEEVIAVARGG